LRLKSSKRSNVPPEADRDPVSREIGVVVVERQLGAGDDEHAVAGLRPAGLTLDVAHVFRPRLLRDANRPALPFARTPPGIARRQDVIRDAEDVEAVPAVEVDELRNRELAVAPGRMRVQLTEQRPYLRARVHEVSLAAPATSMGSCPVTGW
jgi:hypothetical protein